MVKFRILGFMILNSYISFGAAQERNSISLGSNFVTIGGPNSYFHTPSFTSSPYVDAGITAEYAKRLFLKSETSAVSGDTFKNKKINTQRWFTEIGVRINYTRYGITATTKIPFDQDFICSTKRLSINLVQAVNFNLSKSVIINISLLEGFAFSEVTGDTLVSRKYGLIDEQGNSNLRSFSLDINGSLSFIIIPKLYFNIGYTNGLLNIIKMGESNYPVSKEFYPYLRITKTF